MRPHCRRPGQIHLPWLAFLASVALLVGLVAILYWDPWQKPSANSDQPLFIYCAAGLKVPVEAVAQEYEKAYGISVQLQFGGSQTLLGSLQVTKRGDLYIPADDSYVRLAHDMDLLAEVLPLAHMKAVLAVFAGNPRQLRSLDDVLKGKVRLAHANPDAAAVGKLARDALQKHGRWADLEKLIVVQKPTVNDVANDILLGSVDAGIVWDATVRQYQGLEMIAFPELDGATAHVSACVLRSSAQPTATLRFARFLASRDRGLPHFKDAGLEPVEGDTWAEKPELRLLAGAMLRPAIEETITAFEEREGVKVTRVYNGCGILVAQIKAAKEPPDAYFACDTSFMDQVHDLFLDPVPVSVNQLVILVPRGNPHRIKGLRDLGKPGLRVGVGHEKQCALGVLTQETLAQGKVQAPVMKNVKVQSPTGDMLVNQLRTGSLDAVVAYKSNAAEAGDELEAIPIEGIPCAFATQPVAVSKESAHRQLTGRLLERLRSRPSRQRFEELGFRWQTGKPAPGKPGLEKQGAPK
jgi:molybdenum ABC transporter molybdate-binding protein